MVPWWTDHERAVQEFATEHLAGRRGVVRPRAPTSPCARPLPPAVLPRGAAEPVRARVGEGPRRQPRVAAVPLDQRRRAGRPRPVHDRIARRVRRATLRVRSDAEDVPREQRLRDARAAVHARDRDRAALPSAVGRQRRGPRLLRARDRRHGIDHRGDGRGGPRIGRRDPDVRPGDEGGRPRRPRDGGGARRRGGARGRRPAVQRRPETHVPGSGRCRGRSRPISARTSPRSRWPAPARR